MTAEAVAAILFESVKLDPLGAVTMSKTAQAPFVIKRVLFDLFEIVERRHVVPRVELVERRAPTSGKLRMVSEIVPKLEIYSRVRRVRHVNTVVVTHFLVGCLAICPDHVPVPIGSWRYPADAVRAEAGWTLSISLSNRSKYAAYEVVATALGAYVLPDGKLSREVGA
jgi:hypothetical protein